MWAFPAILSHALAPRGGLGGARLICWAHAMKRVTSRQHPLVATCRALARRRDSRDERMLLDGPHLVQDAARAGLPIEAAAASRAALDAPDLRALVDRLAEEGTEVVEVSSAVLEAMSPVATPTGIVAIARRPARSLAAVLEKQPALLIVGIDVQDPGNVGAMARAAEAAGATGLVLCGASADPFGWKALRGSMGSLLRLPVVSSPRWEDAVSGIRKTGARLVATVPRAGVSLFEADVSGPVAFLLGGEGSGLPPEAVHASDLRLSIPMAGPVESLNVAVAAALLVYEAARSRKGGRQ
jgi:TrmH family RNA methyltransferase